jgi:hypothetical protein
VLGALAAIMAATPIASAIADTGGATVRSLPQSEEVQVTAEVQHDCRQFCVWYGEASAYSAPDDASGLSFECPTTLDLSHEVGSGPIERVPRTSSWTFAFNPYAIVVVICLYANDGGNTRLVGQSHPFDTFKGREVLPPPYHPPPRSPAKTSVWITVHGCVWVPHLSVNGETAIGGNVAWRIDTYLHRRWVRVESGIDPVDGTEWGGGEATRRTASYRFSARFLGDANLLPSRKTASVTVRVKRCKPSSPGRRP